MKIEIDDNATFVSVALFIAIAVTTLGVHGCYQDSETKRELYRNGYEEYFETGNSQKLLRKTK
jgi:uncharacterized membrane protein YedE/YeeE